jgi:hypothetical protein
MVDFARRKAEFEYAGFQPRYLAATFSDDMGDFGHEQGLRRSQIFPPTPVLKLTCGWYKRHIDTPYVRVLPTRTPNLVIKFDEFQK